MSADRVFLVTGATGAVGSAIVPLLLAEPRTTVHLLLRAESEGSLADRVDKLVDYWGDRVAHRDLPARLFGVRGDVVEPRLGMAASDYDRLAQTVTHIIHSAGNVKLNASIEGARASALSGSREVVEFARACAKVRASPKLEHLSTVGVAGRRPGLIPEAPLGSEYGYHNTYEQAKAEAESMVLREIEQSGLQATIHRPSMVVGDSRDGRIIHFQVFYHLAHFLAGSRTLGVLPSFGDTRLDLIPADYVAEAVVASSRRSDSVGRIFHLCSGPADAAPLAELGNALREFFRAQGERVFVPRYISPRLMRLLVKVASSFAGRARRALESLPYFLDYLDESQLFANERTTEFFSSDGLQARPVDQFLPLILRYWYVRKAPHR